MLSFESPLCVFLPQPLLEAMMFFMESSLKTEIVNEFLLVVKKYNTYIISQFVSALVLTTPYKVDDDLKNLLRYSGQAFIDIHQDDIKPETALSIADTYNSPKFG